MTDNFSSDNPIIKKFIIKCIKYEFPIIPEYINYDLFEKYLMIDLEFKSKVLSNEWLFVFNSDKIYKCGTYAECCENVGCIVIPDKIIELYKNTIGIYDQSTHITDESTHITDEINDVHKNIITKYTKFGFTLSFPQE